MKQIAICIILAFSLLSTKIPDEVWQEVENTLGVKLSKKEGFYKADFPRTDLDVKIGDIKIQPAFALGAWVAFQPMDKQAMIMGDLVLLEEEENKVVQAVMQQGLEVAAIHNHLLNEKPKIIYMHISGHGEPVALAKKLKAVLSVTGTPMKNPEPSNAQPENWGKVEEIMGVEGTKQGSLLKFNIPRKETIKDGQMEVPKMMGVQIAINFQKVGDKAAITGDFVLLASEVNEVMKTLTSNGIAVTALHSHMLFESPRLLFMHFWAVDNPEKLATGLKAALDKTNYQKK